MEDQSAKKTSYCFPSKLFEFFSRISAPLYIAS